jgi:hypothetical protein
MKSRVRKIETLWLLKITRPFARTLENGSDSIQKKWTVKFLKYKPLQRRIAQLLKMKDADGDE